MGKIPADILKLIDEIYRKNDSSSIKTADWTNYDEYFNDIKTMFPDFEIKNNTDYNYNFGYDYDILDSNTKRSVGINVSKITPYFGIAYYGELNSKDNIVQSVPQTDIQKLVGQKLEAFFISKGYKPISLEDSWQIIPDIETELKELGEVRVRDCIF